MKRVLTALLTAASVALGLHADDGEALVTIPVACMRASTSSASELVSQAVMGTPLMLGQRSGEWVKVETPDGYSGWMADYSFVETSLAAWRHTNRAIITANPGTMIVNDEENNVSPLPLGAIVEIVDSVIAVLPDGRRGYISMDDYMPLDRWAEQEADPEWMVTTALEMTGAPYMWGGMTPSAMDCSGLVRIVYFDLAMLLPRDASQQFLKGEPIEFDELDEGDLIFFDTSNSGRVTHVGIYMGNGDFVHASGQVKVNNLADDIFTPGGDLMHYKVKGFRHIPANDPSYRVASHPWYFNQ